MLAIRLTSAVLLKRLASCKLEKEILIILVKALRIACVRIDCKGVRLFWAACFPLPNGLGHPSAKDAQLLRQELRESSIWLGHWALRDAADVLIDLEHEGLQRGTGAACDALAAGDHPGARTEGMHLPQEVNPDAQPVAITCERIQKLQMARHSTARQTVDQELCRR